MAKDTEKLIRQLSLISYLMAERRPVTALEIRRDVEGYSGMNEDAFARRFYADRSELESLGIHLTVDKPIDGVAEQENYSLRPENFHLSAIAFTDEELASLQFALTLLDGEFAYAEPLRLALQQISWGRPSPLQAPEQRGARARHHRQRRRPRPLPAPGQDRDRDLPPEDDHLRLLHDGARRARRAQGRPLPPALPRRPVLPAGPLARARRAARLPPLAHPAARWPTPPRPSTTSSAPRTSTRARTPTRRLAVRRGARRRAEVWVSDRIAWLVERHFGRFGEIRPGAGRRALLHAATPSARQLAAWALSLGEHARVQGPPSSSTSSPSASARLAELHEAEPRLAPPDADDRAAEARADVLVDGNGRREAAIRPERFARLVTLASILIEAGAPASACARRRLRAPADLRGRAARGRQRAQRRQLRRRLVRPLRRGRRRRLDRGRPRALLGQLRAARRRCCPSRPRRSSPPSTSSASTCPRAP